MGYHETLQKIKSREAHIGVIGLGYVGLPLVSVFIEGGFQVTGFDIDRAKIDKLEARESYIEHIGHAQIAAIFSSGRMHATDAFDAISAVDAIVICVPTPLNAKREPDLGPVLNTGAAIAPHIRAGQLIVLESSTYPGTTDEELAGVLSSSGLQADEDYYLAYSPEREDPGNPDFTTGTIPKVVGADCDAARDLALALYESIIEKVVPVSSTRAAEAVKLTENIFRSVNIAMVNEMKVILDAMGIDVWEVIDAAATKPFGFMPFYPGPGLGGHCIPIDPFYLTYKARQYGHETRFIELAGEINTQMPAYVVERIEGALKDNGVSELKEANILLLGLSYKRDVDDMRESPSLVIMSALKEAGAVVDYYDPHIDEIKITRAHPHLAGQKSLPFSSETLDDYDAVVILTDHRAVDYELLASHARLIVDTRNAMRGMDVKGKIVKA